MTERESCCKLPERSLQSVGFTDVACTCARDKKTKT